MSGEEWPATESWPVEGTQLTQPTAATASHNAVVITEEHVLVGTRSQIDAWYCSPWSPVCVLHITCYQPSAGHFTYL